MDVQGHCDDRFAEVAEEFERNFAERGELGASVAVTVGGETVVDLWGGWADAERTRAWDKDTLCVVMSSHQGRRRAVPPTSWPPPASSTSTRRWPRYWPEFAANGKEGVLVRHLLSHQAGLPALRDAGAAGRVLRLGRRGRPAGRRGAVLGAGHAPRLPRA